MIARRSFLTGLASLLAAPAVVHAGNLMPVKALRPVLPVLPVYAPLEGKIWEVNLIYGWADITGNWTLDQSTLTWSKLFDEQHLPA